MRKWKTILWIVVLSFLSVSCGSRDTDPTQQVVGNQPPGTGIPGLGGGNTGGVVPGGFPGGGSVGGGSSQGTAMPVIYGSDGVYLGAAVPAGADVDSICFQGGEFGSTASPNSIWNYYGAYGAPASPLSVTNPRAQRPPTVCYWDGSQVSNCFAFVSKNRSLGYTTYDPDQLRQSLCY